MPPVNFFDPYYHSVHVVMALVFGALFGSFFNVCIYRIPLGISLAFPGSHCYRCGRPVRWYDNIPLVSYWVLRGRCRQCGAPFSIRYFLVELLTALAFLVTFRRIGYSLALLPALVFLSLLIVGSFTDLDHWIVPDRISLGGLGAGLVLAAIWPVGLAPGSPLAAPFWVPLPAALTPLANALAGAATGFVSLWLVGALGSLVFRKDAMGMGNVKLFAMFGVFCGAFYLLHILILACFIGTAVGLTLIVRSRLERGRAVPEPIAPLVLDTAGAAAMLAAHPLGDEERAAVEQALTRPGPVTPVMHHLPFIPSLAIAAWMVYLYGPQMTRWFQTHVLLTGL